VIAASTPLGTTLATTHQVTAPGGLNATVYEVMPLSTKDDYADAGGRRYRIKSGPWASSVTQPAIDSVTVSWNTDWPADSIVEHGPTPALGSTVTDAAMVTNHAVPLTGLSLGTHWYRVRSKEAAPPGAPALTMRSPLRTFVVRSPIPGDFDGDLDVDADDFAHLQACLSGAGNTQTNPDCFDAQLDGDDDVDSADLQIFLDCLSGPGIPGDPNCAD
jgi:hypothetical protein